MTGVCSHVSTCDFIMNKVALGHISHRVIQFLVSVTFHQCSIIILIYIYIYIYIYICCSSRRTNGRSQGPPSAPLEIEEYFYFFSFRKSLAITQAISRLFLSTEDSVAIPVHSVSGRTGTEKVALTQIFSRNTSVLPSLSAHILIFMYYQYSQKNDKR